MVKGVTGLHKVHCCYWKGDRFAVVKLQEDSSISLIHIPTGCVVLWEGAPLDAFRLAQIGVELEQSQLWRILDRASAGYTFEYLPVDLKIRLSQEVEKADKRAKSPAKQLD